MSGDKVIISLLFPGAVTKLQQAAIAFFMSVCTEQLGSHWVDFHET
jgi:hypothetical protein